MKEKMLDYFMDILKVSAEMSIENKGQKCTPERVEAEMKNIIRYTISSAVVHIKDNHDRR